MHNQWDELRERLLRAGIAPRHVRRYVAELEDHLADLRAEEEHAGRSRTEAAAAARSRLGSVDELAHAMESRPKLRSWSARAPWLVFTAGPVLAIAAAYTVALTLLWTGWNFYLPYSLTPFVRISGFEIFWFGTGRLIYFAAPLVIGWAVSLLAARQRLSVGWPAAGLSVLALIGGTAHVHVAHLGAGWRNNHVGMGFSFADFQATGRAGHTLAFELLSPGLAHVALLFAVAVLPYFVWRWYQEATLA